VERIATADTQASATPPGGPLADEFGSASPLDSGLLDAMPRQREVPDAVGELGLRVPGPAAVSVSASTPAVPRESRFLVALRRLHPWRLLPTPTGTPFTFGYGCCSSSLRSWRSTPIPTS
jgi:hypothetical protein